MSDLTPEQYHANISKLWEVLGISNYAQAEGMDVFSLVISRIEGLEARITEALIALQDPPQITTAIAALEKKT